MLKPKVFNLNLIIIKKTIVICLLFCFKIASAQKNNYTADIKK